MREVICPSCGTINRVAADKDATTAKCGRCHKPIFSGVPVDVTEAEFAKHRRTTKSLPLLVDVWAPWCGPCRTMGPHFAAAAQQLEPNVRLLKLNGDTAPSVMGEFGISGIPTLLLLRNGGLIAQHAGAMTAGQIVAWTQQALMKPEA